WPLILIVEQISIIIMPLLVTRVSSIIGNLRLAKWATVTLSIFFFLSFFTESILLILFFTFPFFLRIYNNSLNPYISKTSGPDSRSFVFAIRDFFLYLGVATGLVVSTIIFTEDFSFLNLIRFFSVVFLVSAGFLFLKKEEHKPKDHKNHISLFSFPLKKVSNKRTLIVFVLIFTGFTWIMYVIKYIPLYFVDIGFLPSEIFFTYALTYLAVPFMAIVASLFVTEKNLKKWYLFDIIIDIVPFTLILFAGLDISIAVFALLFIQLRDFLGPIGIAYFFNSFDEDEQNEAWGVLGTFNSLVALPFPLLVSVLFGFDPTYLFVITVITILIVFVIAYSLLPNKNKES
ncbi:MAG: MFS transporter, partial [Promethearchaeota archaeon]